MYNTVTEELIRRIPHVEGFTENLLPVTLTTVYAQIISLSAKYKDGEIPFDLEILEDDRRKLNILSNTLELYLFANPYSDKKKSIAYVAATARKLLFKIRGVQENEILDLNYVPSDLYASLLYIISGNFADAQEIAESFSIYKDTDKYIKKLYKSVKLLVNGNLTKLRDLPINEPREDHDLHQYLQQLFWKELVVGIKQFSNSLLGQEEYSIDSFLRVKELSVYEDESLSLRDVYVAPYILSILFILSCEEMWSHAVINISTPVGVEENSWKSALKKQAEVRPFLWENHLEAIDNGILNVGISSVITYPTGAGKTTLSELKIVSCLLANKRVIYLVPTHALENQVNNSLAKLTDRMNISILNRDGEFSWFEEDEEDNTIMVMTPERCLALLRLDPEKLHNVGLVVFDEFHLVHGNFNDKRANDAMTLVVELFDILPEADYFFVSAMVRNGKDIAGWIKSVTGHECILLDSPWKPTCQLQGCMVYDEKEINKLKAIIARFQSSKKHIRPTTSLNNMLKATPYCIFSLKSAWDDIKRSNYCLVELTGKPVNLRANNEWILSSNYNSVAAEVASRYAAIHYKTIIFATKPMDANAIRNNINKLLKWNNIGWIELNEKEKFNAVALELGGEKYSYLFESESATVHHGNLLPEERIISEHYFRSKDGVNVLVATPTLAQGINLPADIVLIAGDKRFVDNSWEQIKAHEILNAAGRAGRAGFRSHGTAILIPSIIATYGDRVTKGNWMTVRDEIFSKGDRCLDIKDPISDFFSTEIYTDNDLILKHFKVNVSDMKRKYGKTFYAYQMGLKGRTTEFNTHLDALVTENLLDENIEQSEWLSVLSAKTSVDPDLLIAFYESINLDFITGLDDHIVIYMLVHLKTVMKEKLDLMDKFFSSMNNSENAKKFVLPKETNLWTESGVEKFFTLVEMYVKGKSLLELEQAMECKQDKKLLHARQFVLKIIPDVSYTCGAFIQVLIEKNGPLEDIPKDMKVFASCIKEGVLTYEMLKEKYNNKYMRVECHHRYKKI
ncbi:DEAD/DEAH box helicase [Bacteroides caecicola]|uniref:DEAD/DEAH box helicase n=1 Tax=Bacteroides caecicola TaxID=1462569 RepID=UPI002011DBFB|nr:DEAD/DEAH box helicase [Bacteroides caecicola]MCL1627065.1 DEAD/DEAH box helicase [Bacteroides caecicola]